MENGPMVIDPSVHSIEEIERFSILFEQVRTYQAKEHKVRVEHRNTIKRLAQCFNFSGLEGIF
jgi:hypothetical protein